MIDITFKETLIRLALAAFLSSLIGFERELRHKGPDLRTFILVGVGSALVVLTSINLFATYKDITIVDPTRMIAGLITGIGFLCAGTIIQAGANVKGLTTAATVWIVSCIGIAAGAGHYKGAITVTALVIFIMLTLRPIEKMLGDKFSNNDQ